MPQNDDPNDDQKPAGGEPKTFTQEQVNALLAEQKRKVGEKFADYEDIKAKASKLDEIEQASKSELEREREARATAESELTKYREKEQVSQWAAEIVKDSEIPAVVLRGSTREELEEHFNQLKALAPQKPKRTPVPAGKPAGGGETGSAAVAALRQLRGSDG